MAYPETLDVDNPSDNRSFTQTGYLTDALTIENDNTLLPFAVTDTTIQWKFANINTTSAPYPRISSK